MFAHVPLWALYEKWGWTTEDGSKALAQLARFDAVTVLNGRIHQIIQYTECNIRFATAAATAYPQPAPGTADTPGPLKVPDGICSACSAIARSSCARPERLPLRITRSPDPTVDAELMQAFIVRRPDALEAVYSLHAKRLYASRVPCSATSTTRRIAFTMHSFASGQTGIVPARTRGFAASLTVCVRNEAVARKRIAARHLQIEMRADDERPHEYTFEIADHPAGRVLTRAPISSQRTTPRSWNSPDCRVCRTWTRRHS